MATFVILGTALGAGLSLTTTKVYEASVQVFVATSAHADSARPSARNSSIADRVRSYASIAATPAVTSAVITELKLDLTDRQLADKISADVPPHTVLVNLHVTDTEPLRAARLVNAVAARFAAVVRKIDRTTPSGPGVKLKVIRPAAVPESPIRPTPAVDIGVGALLGLLLGVCVAILRDVLGATIRQPEDVERLGIPVLGYVALDEQAPDTPIALRDDPHSATSDSYRLLRTRLDAGHGDGRPRVVAVTSAMPGAGKTTTALNLAAALAVSGYRVCLLELDLRRPTLAHSLGLADDVGFTTAVTGRAPVASVLQNVGQNLAVITAGPLPPNPGDVVMSTRAKAVIEEVAARVDYTIVDTSSLLAVTDAAHVAALADATILVLRAGSSTRNQVRRSVETLARVGVTPTGVVLTRTGAERRHDGAVDRHHPPGRAQPAPRPGAAVVPGSGQHRSPGTPQEAAVSR